MKVTYIQDVANGVTNDSVVTLYGWCKKVRHHKNRIFIDVVDSTGVIQVVVEKNIAAQTWQEAMRVKVESAVTVRGKVLTDGERREIKCQEFKIISLATRQQSPPLRSDLMDTFDESHIAQILDNRHLYIRNPKMMAVLQFRALIKRITRQWFEKNGFIEIDAPILTPIPLYEDDTAVQVNIKGDNVFLTQCVGYYLEAAVHAFEKVYNMGPSFRGEESRSKRHLMEYWHIKAEIAFANREDIITLVESIMLFLTQSLQSEAQELVSAVGTNLCVDGLKIPFPRISYDDAIIKLQKGGSSIQYGKSIGSQEEQMLSQNFATPFWITDPPRSTEPFPYVVHPENSSLVMVADLIASNGYGELLGTAEKIWQLDMLDERMKEKGKFGDRRFDWVREVHEYGCVPHAAFGMGLERLIRWLLNIPHVRDTIPFPRIFRRKITP
ncbi:hypothetical protein COT99_00950 [Candidatus Falkowbacteria bacterium CG10_big_fil_rev_8_21_14_0_10_43_10]|uniref:Aminoacyl-transfer RNA synthetases class-II family profile domain-containing protein n=1 Tax=Candidatus Falkowbacteria bacterium CG10_big_fil_rev_8_21_14_0_10_43_10 TaxID=1974567 RepID=A0A2H0V2Q3_9BACT|nr:MAG: hypothetical protein COT99_00950 [Candidatus Falkowbacteria bacterium CG10_big_fil_rev_8_21_14_0_10_43_10]